MYDITYNIFDYVIESADPLVNIVKTSPWTVFARPYMGYLLFLFGDADRETASWIRDNLQALDSLTGPDIQAPSS